MLFFLMFVTAPILIVGTVGYPITKKAIFLRMCKVGGWASLLVVIVILGEIGMPTM
jgi:hypothetical protein